MITITKKAMEKSKALVAAFDVEVGWFGFVTKDGAGLTIRDIYAPKHQIVSSATVSIEEEGDSALIDFEDKCRAEYGKGAALSWFHSHVNMGVSPSGTDETQLKKFKGDHEYYIRVIMNKRGEISVALAVFGYVVDVKDIKIEEDNQYKAWADDVKKQIMDYSDSKKPKHNTFSYSRQGWSAEHGTFSFESDDIYTNESWRKKTLGNPIGKKTAKKIYDILPLAVCNDLLIYRAEDIETDIDVERIIQSYPLYKSDIMKIMAGRT